MWLVAVMALVLASCGVRKERRPYLLEGAWTLAEMEWPMGDRDTFPQNGRTLLRFYDGDSALCQCGLTRTSSGALVVNLGFTAGSVTLIDKGGGEYVYLEENAPHPLELPNDTTLIIQYNGVRHTWHRADELDREWGAEIRGFIGENLARGEVGEGLRYVLSAKEREQARTIHWFTILGIALVVALLFFVQRMLATQRERRRLLLQLQQITEVTEHRAQSVREAIETEETAFFVSDEYHALRRRIAQGNTLTTEEWQQVEAALGRVYPGFATQLRSLHDMSPLEYQVCLLIKLRIPPTDMAALLSRDASTISTVRSRLYGKVFGHKAGARAWDDFILSIKS